jgi:competence protein ComEA
VDPNAAPWRALETTTPESSGREAPSPSSPTPWVAPAAMLAAVALAIVAFIVAAGGTGGDLTLGGEVVGVASPGPESDTEPREAPAIVVHIVGAVRDPGVYRLDPGARVADLVERAGGYGPRVDVERTASELNLAALLADGEQIRVPSRDDPSPAPVTAAVPGGSSGAGGGTAPISLNRASATELDTLPGIGPVTAGKIIAAREEQPFTSVDELRGRKIVGEKTFEKLRDLVTVD